MNIVYGAEMHNWVLECEGIHKVTMTKGMTKVTFIGNDEAIASANRLTKYSMNNYLVQGNVITLKEDI